MSHITSEKSRSFLSAPRPSTQEQLATAPDAEDVKHLMQSSRPTRETAGNRRQGRKEALATQAKRGPSQEADIGA